MLWRLLIHYFSLIRATDCSLFDCICRRRPQVAIALSLTAAGDFFRQLDGDCAINAFG